MTKRIKSLAEVSESIGEEIGKFKELNRDTGYYISNFRNARGFELKERKIRMQYSFEGKKQPTSFGYFKSKEGYSSKYKNNKEHANHFGEYISYIILQQLGKKACKVELAKAKIKNPYSQKEMEIEGILSHYQLGMTESFIPASVIIEDYKYANSEEYRELAQRGATNSDKNYTNIEIILKAFEYKLRNEGQEDKIPEMRKAFFDMCMFDIKFANRDRHEENFGMKVDQKTGELNFYHLFDNEQILGMNEDRSFASIYLEDDRAFEKFKTERLTSCIGTPDSAQKIEAKKLLEYLLEKFPKEAQSSLDDINRYTLADLVELMDRCEGLSQEHKKLAIKIYTAREMEINKVVANIKRKKSLDEEEPSY